MPKDQLWAVVSYGSFFQIFCLVFFSSHALPQCDLNLTTFRSRIWIYLIKLMNFLFRSVLLLRAHVVARIVGALLNQHGCGCNSRWVIEIFH